MALFKWTKTLKQKNQTNSNLNFRPVSSDFLMGCTRLPLPSSSSSYNIFFRFLFYQLFMQKFWYSSGLLLNKINDFRHHFLSWIYSPWTLFFPINLKSEWKACCLLIKCNFFEWIWAILSQTISVCVIGRKSFWKTLEKKQICSHAGRLFAK